jgi:hypothetical protein
MVFVSFVRAYTMFFNRNPVSAEPSKVNLQPSPCFEVACGFEAFCSLEELAPNLDWHEVLAASWGIPYVEEDLTLPKTQF